MKKVPTLDIRRYETDRDAFVAELGAADREFGFSCISGHCLPTHAIDGAFDAFKPFFALPDAPKRQYLIPGAGEAHRYPPYLVDVAGWRTGVR